MLWLWRWVELGRYYPKFLNKYNYMPLFSVITIAYNSIQTIERTIQSVLNQTFSDFEYVIVDGGSTDETIDVIKKYEPLFDGRLKWKSEPDKGIYDAMNKGIQRSRGSIIGIVNSDDWLEPEALSIVYNTYQNNNLRLDCIYTGAIRFHSNNGWKKELMPDIQKFKSQANNYIMAGIRHPATFVPKAVYEKIGIFDSTMKILADTDLMVWAYYSNIDFIPINKVVSNMADGGASNGKIQLNVSKNALSDKKKMLSRYNLSPLKYAYVIGRWKMMHYIRTVSKILKLYRVR